MESFDEQNPQPYSIPVGSQEEIKKIKAYGGNPVVVPAKVASLLKNETARRFEELVKIPCGTGMTLKDKFLRWYDAYEGKLPDSSKSELKSLIEELE